MIGQANRFPILLAVSMRSPARNVPIVTRISTAPSTTVQQYSQRNGFSIIRAPTPSPLTGVGRRASGVGRRASGVGRSNTLRNDTGRQWTSISRQFAHEGRGSFDRRKRTVMSCRCRGPLSPLVLVIVPRRPAIPS